MRHQVAPSIYTYGVGGVVVTEGARAGVTTAAGVDGAETAEGAEVTTEAGAGVEAAEGAGAGGAL